MGMRKARSRDPIALAEKAKKIKQSINGLDGRIRELQKEKSASEIELDEVKRLQNELLNPKPITVTAHAILRYLERHEGVNIQEVEKILANAELQKWVEQLGGEGRYPSAGGQVVLENYTILTYIIPDEPNEPIPLEFY